MGFPIECLLNSAPPASRLAYAAVLNKLRHAMLHKSPENRRHSERRVDKITTKVRVMAGTLKRTISASVAKRYLEQNGYSVDAVDTMLLNSVERRLARRRADNRPARFQSKKEKIRSFPNDKSFSPLTADEIKLLYQIRSANDSKGVVIRIRDCPTKLARFGLMEQGTTGPRITQRGRAILLHWARAQALHLISCGQKVGAFEMSVQTWLENNHFIEIGDEGLVATPRGTGWLETRSKTLDDLGSFPIYDRA